jgi:hypothetical protein
MNVYRLSVRRLRGAVNPGVAGVRRGSWRVRAGAGISASRGPGQWFGWVESEPAVLVDEGDPDRSAAACVRPGNRRLRTWAGGVGSVIGDTPRRFGGWRQHDDVVMMSAELGLGVWTTDGGKLWTTFVEFEALSSAVVGALG